jgi:L-malate glycosyltransferase
MLTVLLATRNRAGLLQQTLESFCFLQEPSGGWQMVVADNGSTDQTPAVLASFANRLPLRTLSEPKGGKNSALNAALSLAVGDLTVLTDDDTFPRTDWLVELRKAADAQPGYSIFGGVVRPRWGSPPPHWIEWVKQDAVYTLTDPLLKDGHMPAYNAFGPNMAIRSAVFQSGIRFDTSIGPRGSSYPMGSETELTLRLSRQGYKAWHVSTAVVDHFIRADQIQKSWVLDRAVRYGRGKFRLRELEGSGAPWSVWPQWFGVPRRFFRDIFEEEMRVIWGWLTLNERERLSACWNRNCAWGHIVEANASRLDRRRVALANQTQAER